MAAGVALVAFVSLVAGAALGYLVGLRSRRTSAVQGTPDTGDRPLAGATVPGATVPGPAVEAAGGGASATAAAGDDGTIAAIGATDAAVGELAAAVAHGLNNPLTAILGFAELLSSELPAGDPRQEEAAVIRSEAVRARAAIRGLLDLARPRTPVRVATDVNDLVHESIEVIREHTADVGIVVAESYDEMPAASLDPDAIREALLNLFDNAIQAMPAGGCLDVSTRARGDRVAIVVADDGVGMDERTQRDVFSPFVSLGAGRGAGLGLTLCRRIVESHEGTIDVESEPGKGSRFTIELPSGAAGVPGPAGADVAA